MTNLVQSRTGSLWRRWDLHIHAPGTKLSNAYGSGTDESVWDRYLDELEKSPVDVFGITDYFCCDTYFELIKRFKSRHPESNKIFFPNLEFRLSESISKDGGHPNIHIIFSNDTAHCGEDRINRFLSSLNTQSIDDANIKRRCCDLKSESDFESATVTLDGVLGALNEAFGSTKPYLLAFPANNDGLRSTDNSSPRKVALADRIDRECDIFFGNAGNKDFLLRTDRYKSGESLPKPVVSGSDAHSFNDLERLSGDVSGYPPTWIKADSTFRGLQQITYEPESRVYIGATPDVLIRQEQDGTKFLKSLVVNQVDGYHEKNGEWFKNVELSLNPELVAVIGNKGSGKSALVDILGLLGNSRQEAYFSFLTDQAKSKKFRQRGYAENFYASITWLANKIEGKLLSDYGDKDKPETVRYLPQNYFEQLTNEIEIEKFRYEIEEVVFSHVDETEKLGKSTFPELEAAKTLQSKHETSSLKQHLRELNEEIVRLEEQSSSQYRRQLESEIAAKKQELEALDGAKPKEVPKPDAHDAKQAALAKRVDDLTSLLSDLSDAGHKTVSEISDLKTRLQNAISLRESLSSLVSGFHEKLSELHTKFSALELSSDSVITISSDFYPIDEKIKYLNQRVKDLEQYNNPVFDDSTDYTVVKTLPDLRAAYTHVNKEIEKLKEQLGTPQRRYQAFIERVHEWANKRQEIVGDSEDPKPETLSYLANKLRFVDEVVKGELEEKNNARREVVRKIFSSKDQVLQFYSDLKSSVEARLVAVRKEGFEIEIDASFVVDNDFVREFLNHVNQRKRGPFRNNHEALQEVSRRIQETDWSDCDAVITFCEDLINYMRFSGGSGAEELKVSDQAHDVKELYDFLFSIDYLSSRYELRLGGKNLNELSPGEKGLLLLIFYLQLDRKNTPLIIA